MRSLWLSLLVLIGVIGCSSTRPAVENPSPPPPAPLDISSGNFSPEVGFSVIRIEDGGTERQRSENADFIPASTGKLITAIASIATLPPNHRFYTRLCASAAPDADGVLKGDLILEGGGDPTLTLKNLLNLADVMVRLPISSVQGEFLIDDSQSPKIPQIAASQPPDAVYNPGLSALSVAENAIRIEKRSRNRLWLVPPSGSPPLEMSDGGTHSNIGYVWRPVGNPSENTGRLFTTFAKRLGLDLPSARHAAAGCPFELARHQSPLLQDIVKQVLETSSNPMAELLGLAADRARGTPPKDLASSAERTGNWLQNHFNDIDWRRFFMENHSGLSSRARITPRQMARLLAAAYRDPAIRFGPAYLTPAGWGGHLRHRLVEPETATLVWAKTGTMHYGVGLAGFLLSDDGVLRSFAIYAIDRDARTAYDALGPSPPDAADRQAEAWDKQARLFIDNIVVAWMRDFAQ